MAYDVTRNPYNIDNGLESIQPMKRIEPKPIPIKNEPLSIMAPKDGVNSIAAPEKKGSIFGKIGNLFRSDMGNSLHDAGKNMKALDNQTANFGENAVKDFQAAGGLELSGKKPTVNSASATNGELVVNPITMEKTLPAQATPAPAGTPPVITGNPVADIKKVENEPGSLGAIKEKKKAIEEKYTQKLKEDPKVKAYYEKKQKEIRTKYADNPTKMEAKLKKLDKKIENKAEKIAGKIDKNYQELSKDEANEQKKVDQYADYDLKDVSGKKLSKEDISNLGKQGKLFDEKGKPISEEEFAKQGFKKTLTDKAAEADPMRAIEEGTKEQKYKAFAMMMSGKAPTTGGATKAPAKDAWMGDVAGLLQGLTKMNEQRKSQQRFGSLTQNWG